MNVTTTENRVTLHRNMEEDVRITVYNTIDEQGKLMYDCTVTVGRSSSHKMIYDYNELYAWVIDTWRYQVGVAPSRFALDTLESRMLADPKIMLEVSHA